jgi:hypothetical protein
VTRAWADTNGNFIPDCNLANRGQNGECGPLQNLNFGSPVITTRFSDDVLKGYGVRPYNWDLGAEVQHQIGARMSASAGYYRNWYGNFRVTDNLLVAPEDFNPFCVTGPADSRLPGGGNTQVCGLLDINPAKFGQVSNLVRPAKDFGKQTQVSNFFTLAMEARLGAGARFGGGIDTGRTTTDICDIRKGVPELTIAGVVGPTNPFCHITQPFSANTQIKLNGSYQLPYDVFVSGVYQNLPGPPYTADFAAPVAAIQTSLGRPLSGGARTATVPLIQPQTRFEDRTTRLDLRLGKMVRISQRMRVQANLDLYNALNSSSVLQDTNAYGARWLVPTLMLEPRILQFSAQVTF